MSTIRTVSYSELDTFRQCPLKHQLSYKEMWGSTDESEALERGTLFHSVLESHYRAVEGAQTGKRVPNGPTVVSAVVAEHLQDPQSGEQTDRQALVEWIYRGYVENYGMDPDWRVEAIEKSFEVRLPNEDGSDSDFVLAGTCDLIVRDMSAGGGLWIVDHKTCKDLPKQKDFDMEDQTGIYAYLLKRSGLNIRGAIYNHCRTYRLKTREMEMDERYKRTLTVRTDEELRIMALEALDAMEEAYRERTRDARRHPDGERCGWKCGYTEPCLAARKGQDLSKLMKDFGFVRGDHKPGPTFSRLAAAEAAQASTDQKS